MKRKIEPIVLKVSAEGEKKLLAEQRRRANFIAAFRRGDKDAAAKFGFKLVTPI
jgi:hypothetical protein